jgi:membrane fusion protein (multidrug efflux system)
VNFGISQDAAHTVHVGQKVQVTASDIPGLTLEGRVTAIDSVVDPNTRNVQVQATFSNPHAKLRPGMFVDAELNTGASQSVIALPSSSISYAPYGNSVFVVADLKGPDGKTYRGARQQFVKLDRSRGDQVAVVSGVNPGEEVVTSGTFRLRGGAPISVHNEVQPSNNPAPKPEDN